MDLVFGAGRLDRHVAAAEDLLISYRDDTGLRYLDHRPCTPADVLVPEDLAVTILINSRASSDAFASVQDRAPEIDLASLPDTPLEDTSGDERQAVTDLLAQVASWRGFGASVATKVLHKKRSSLIPILDNQAIFGAYMNPRWPYQRSSEDTVRSSVQIREALDWIHRDLTRAENINTWPALSEIEPARSRIELFDMVWWMYFRTVEPVGREQRL
ncbi:MAG: DUF6308 family protein [Gaiellaceae bacterium]|jgi:hypothetical protein